ncbi:MAG: family oligoendopeptidase [Solirubrobacterales bacterium]|nr:family oligoendopeptidase [Solirubrobacterales bacterium]
MPTASLQDVTWNLEHLVDDEGPEGVDRLLEEAAAKAATFAARHAGKVAQLDGAGLAAAMDELASIHDLAGRAGNYAALRFSADTSDPVNGALMQKAEERGTTIETQLLFFELEWAAIDDARADDLLVADGLDNYRHYLETVRIYRPHLLSEPEEKILTEKNVSGRSAWGRLFSELMIAVEVQLPDHDEPVQMEVATSQLMRPEREARAAAQQAITEALEPGLRTRAFIFNTLLHDKAVDDRLRNYPSWISSRNLSNEASDESVEALVQAVQANYDIPQRWYRVKAGLLGIDKLADYDRMAPVTTTDEEFEWDEACGLVLDAYESFSDELGGLVRQFFDDRWIDAPVRPGKRGGAFCAYTVPSVHPYVLLNYTSRRRDVLTLAHELGHGVHAALARPRGPFEMATPLTLAETASVFGETIVFGRLLDRAPSAESRLGLLAESLEGSIATVFRQVAMNRFEHSIHTARREQGELSIDQINEFWVTSQTDLMGDSVEVTDNYKSWWSYVPHFIGTPGYVYAYAYGQLLALSVYARYLEEGEPFVPRYLDMLRSGGSKSPEQLGELVGIDLADPSFWDNGLQLVRRQLEDAEAAAAEAGTAA